MFKLSNEISTIWSFFLYNLPPSVLSTKDGKDANNEVAKSAKPTLSGCYHSLKPCDDTVIKNINKMHAAPFHNSIKVNEKMI